MNNSEEIQDRHVIQRVITLHQALLDLIRDMEELSNKTTGSIAELHASIQNVIDDIRIIKDILRRNNVSLQMT